MHSGKVLLAIDQGTTNTKALLVDQDGQAIFRVSLPMKLYAPEPAFIEQEPDEIWQAVCTVIGEAAVFAASSGMRIEGLAISNQRETALAWHRETGQALAPAVSWQCRRSAGVCENVIPHADTLRRSTGLPLDPVLSATKWSWLLENVPAIHAAANEGQLCLGTVDSWSIYKLTAGRAFVTDLTNASRTGLLDLNTQQWNPELLELFRVPLSALPELRSSAGHLGVCAAIAEIQDVPIVAALGDSHAALAGHGEFRPGTVKATYGTGSSLMTLTEALPGDQPSLARTIAWALEGHTQFALEGNIAMTGSAVQWAGEFLGLQDPVTGILALAERAPNSDGVYMVPAMVGLAAPHWRAEARGVLCGLGRGHTAAHMARAALESIAFQVADLFFAMEQALGTRLPALRADGGVTRNREVMQLQADLLGVQVLRSHQEELSAMGAAYLAGYALGWWPTLEDLSALPREVDRIMPRMEPQRRPNLYEGWKAAVSRALLNTGAQA